MVLRTIWKPEIFNSHSYIFSMVSEVSEIGKAEYNIGSIKSMHLLVILQLCWVRSSIRKLIKCKVLNERRRKLVVGTFPFTDEPHGVINSNRLKQFEPKTTSAWLCSSAKITKHLRIIVRMGLQNWCLHCDQLWRYVQNKTGARSWFIETKAQIIVVFLFSMPIGGLCRSDDCIQ